jgi:hypothetical protein
MQVKNQRQRTEKNKPDMIFDKFKAFININYERFINNKLSENTVHQMCRQSKIDDESQDYERPGKRIIRQAP